MKGGQKGKGRNKLNRVREGERSSKHKNVKRRQRVREGGKKVKKRSKVRKQLKEGQKAQRGSEKVKEGQKAEKEGLRK